MPPSMLIFTPPTRSHSLPNPVMRPSSMRLFDSIIDSMTRGKILTRACMRPRSEEHTSELQSRLHLVCRLLLEKKNEDCSFQRCISHALDSPPSAARGTTRDPTPDAGEKGVPSAIPKGGERCPAVFFEKERPPPDSDPLPHPPPLRS